MSKIVLAINKMISNQDRIKEVAYSMLGRDEIFFVYDNYKWSIECKINTYILKLYPEYGLNISCLESDSIYQNVPVILFKSEDIKTQEALESFRELYDVLKMKKYNVDGLLDSIINS